MARVLACMTILVLGGSVFAGDPEDKGDRKTRNQALYPRVKMATSLGDIVLELDAEHCPITVMNFVWYAEQGFYEGTIFHRVITDMYIQGGGYLPDLSKKTEGLRPGIPNEWDAERLNLQWTITMVRAAGRPNSATSQFLINVNDLPKLDGTRRDGYGSTVFGKVVEGFKTVAKIRDTSTTTSDKYGGSAETIPEEPVLIKSVKLISKFDRTHSEAIATRAIKELNDARILDNADVATKVKAWVKKLEDEAGTRSFTTERGVVFVDFKVGEGISPNPTDEVTIHYTGWLTDGTEFHSSRARDPYTFVLNEYLSGWVEGIKTMKPGGRRKMILPEELAFGPYGRPGMVPPHAPVIYDIELISVSR